MAIAPPNSPALATQSTWKNPTDKPVKLHLYRGGGDRQPYEDHEIPPGGTLTLPSMFDRGIRHVRNGQVVQGCAPMLHKVGEEPIPVHPSIDVQAQERKAREEAKIVADAAQRKAELLVHEAELRIRKAEEREAAAEARAAEAEAKAKAAAEAKAPEAKPTEKPQTFKSKGRK